jgi:hypothetical protein
VAEENPTQTAPPAPDQAVAPESPPMMPGPSPTVQPFVSGGGPPPEMTPKPRRSHRAFGFLLVLMILAAAGAWTYITYGDQIKQKIGITKPVSKTQPQSLTAQLNELDKSVGDLEANYADTEAAAADKAGDISE